MTNSRVSFPHRLGALLTLLAFIFTTLAPARGVLSQARGSIIFPRYDELGNQLTQTDALGHTTRYSYDNLGRRTGRTLPGGQTESMTYNRPGTVFDRTDFNGTITRHTYDALDRLLTRTVTSTAAGVTPVNVSFTYTASGRRETMTDATGVTRYFYDQRDRLQRKDTPEGALNYGYEDASGLLTNMHSDTSGGAASSYTYDDLGRLKTATDVNGQTTTYGYDEVGNLSGVTLPNGVASGYSYNELNRLQTLEINRGATSLAHFTYAVAPTGHRHRSVESGSGLQPANPTAFRTRTWSYDALWRLRGETLAGRLPLGGTATMPNGTATYALDAVGNRTALTSTIAGLTSQTLAYNANDRITGDTYDANGNTQGAAVSQPPSAVPPGTITGTDTYDAADRLLSRTGAAGNTESLSYDGDGHRVRESVTRTGVTTNTTLLVDDLNPTGYAQGVEEWTNGVLSKVFHYGHALISQDALLGPNWTLAYYGYDGHGSVRFLTDPLGAVTDTYEYDAFGDLLATTGATPNRHRYCGERFDENLGLYYLRARLMNPLTGRFWTADSYEGSQSDPKSLHKYLYAHTNPISGIDPSGKFTLTEYVTVAAIVAVIVLAIEAKPIFTWFQEKSRLSGAQDLDDAHFRLALSELENLQRWATDVPEIRAKLDNLVRGFGNRKDVFEYDYLPSYYHVHVLKRGKGEGAHDPGKPKDLYIPQEAVDDGPLAAALFTFGEFQHSEEGGLNGKGMTEPQANTELGILRNQIPSGLRTPYINNAHHSNLPPE